MPSGKHRMKRPQPLNAVPKGTESDIRKIYSKEQLEEIGAITLQWNKIEIFIDWLMLIILHIPPFLWLSVTKRFSGIPAKLEILRIFADQNKILTDDAKSCIRLTLDAIGEYKKYRDVIIHSLPFDAEQMIAHRIGSRAEMTQVIVSIEALKGVSERMRLMLKELPEIDVLFRLGDPEGAKKVYGGKVPDPEQQRRTRDVPIQTVQARNCQKLRLSLPQLPEFPDEVSNPLAKE